MGQRPRPNTALSFALVGWICGWCRDASTTQVSEDRMIHTRVTRHRAQVIVRSGRLLVGLVALLGVAACGDDDNIVIPSSQVIVTTFRDSTFNFGALTTFSMPDTVIHFQPVTGTPIPVTRQFDATILNQVRADFLARGYTEAAPGTLASFVVLVGATESENYNAWIGYPWFTYWGYWPGWAFFTPGFDNSWTIIYPWYPVVGVTAYSRGTLIVDLIPTAQVNPLGRSIQSAWAGVATGLLTSSPTNAGVAAVIDQMFALSPYLVAQ